MKNKLYILCGYPFSGKSVLSAEIVKKRPCEVVSVDEIKLGMGFFKKDHKITMGEWEKAYSASHKLVENLLKQKKSVIHEGANCLKQDRDKLRSIALKYGAKPILIYVKVSEEIVRNRVLLNRISRSRNDVSDDDFNWCVENLEDPGESEEPLIYSQLEAVDIWVNNNL